MSQEATQHDFVKFITITEIMDSVVKIMSLRTFTSFSLSLFLSLKPPPCLPLPYVLLSTRRNKTKSSSHIKKGFIRSLSTDRAGLGEAKKLQSLVI